jgi:hypothetical protein
MKRSSRIKALAASLGALAFAAVSLSAGNAAAAGWYNCVPTSVFEYNGELEVSCSNNWTTGVNWVGLTISSATDMQEERFVQFATAAILSGKRFRVYMTDTACPVAGSNCRLATSWSLYPP